MRAFLALVCSLALACIGVSIAYGKEQKKQQQNRASPDAGQTPAYHGAVAGASHVNVSTNKSAGTGKPAGGQALQQNRHTSQTGTSTEAGKRMAVGKLTGAGKPTTVGKQTTTARRRHFNPANTPTTQVTPAPKLQQNSSIQLLNTPITPITEITPAVQLQQNGSIQLLNTPITPITEIAPGQFKQNSGAFTASASLFGAAGGGQLPPPPGGWKPYIGPPGSVPKQAINPPGDGGSGQSGGSGRAGNASNGPQTEVAPAGSQSLPPPTVMSTSYSATAANKPITEIAPAVQFQQNKRIKGSDRWVDSNYEVFRNYRSEWHDRDWWRSHQSRVVFGVGGWYYWNAGYWFPAWGYDPNAYYPYDGPIYGYNDLPPDQVVANVQEALQQQGHYKGEVDGLLGLPTRTAIADYQRDHGLYETSTIDRPTSQSLGMK